MKKEETPKAIPKKYTNYYLNTIKGNKFMFFALLIQNK